MNDKPHILFVCGGNQWRSPTAVRIFSGDPRFKVRAAGVGSKSRHPLTEHDVDWADLILVMEQKHKTRIQESFRDHELPAIDVLEIPDEFQLMDPELVEMLRDGTEFYFKSHFGVV